HTPHGGKLSVARVLQGQVADGTELFSSGGASGRVSGIYRLLGKDQSRLAAAEEGDTVALGKLDDIATGDTLGTVKDVPPLAVFDRPAPVYTTAMRPKE